VPYIHTLAPRFIQHLNSPETLQITGSATDRELLISELDCLERLVAEVEDSRRVTMMALYIPILVSLLLDETTGPQAGTERRALSDRCLERLTELGRLYPEHLRTVMSASAQLKPRLEAAVRLRQKNQAAAKARAAARSAGPQQTKPSITLKMDFSNFKT
jgi:hypothetical protein